MVSFQCEGCGDVLTKKKLDSHRNQCRGAPFTCIDCMTTFRGSDYRAHTSCITEDQKYQGALYREKPSKAAKRKSVTIVEPNEEKSLLPRAAYVEDVSEIDAPPPVPSPPPAVPSDKTDSVFDYMVEDEPTSTPRITFAENRTEMSMKGGAPTVFGRSDEEEREHQRYSKDYEENGWSYGNEPVDSGRLAITNGSTVSLDFMTPAPKISKTRSKDPYQPSGGHSRTNSGSEKKRKRSQPDNLVGTPADTTMTDTVEKVVAPASTAPAVAHSGLTGGLSRLMSDHEKAYPFRTSPSSDEHDDHYRREREASHRRALKGNDPMSPSKRTRRTSTKEEGKESKDTNGLGITIKDRAAKALSMVGGALLPAGQVESTTKTRRRASSSDHGVPRVEAKSDEKRDRKKHKVHRANGTTAGHVRFEHSPKRQVSDEARDEHHHHHSHRKLKAIEYKKDDSLSDSEEDRKKKGGNSQMVVFGAAEKSRQMCEMFLSNVPGTESDKGYSVNKALKRWHKACDIRSTTTKLDEEKELWRHLRLRKNERGEIVVFC